MTEFKLDFYDVAKCGFFQRGRSTPEFGNLNQMLEDFQAWVRGLRLGDTRNQDPDYERNILPTYCFDFLKDAYTGDYFLVTWNEVQSDDGLVSSINLNDQVGDADVEATELPEDNIPGYATYFWFIAERDVLVSCRPKGMAFNGHQNLRRYLGNFLSGFARQVVFNTDNDTIIGYAADGIYRDDSPRVYPKFETYLKSHDTDIQYLFENIERVRKVIKKSSLHFDVLEDRTYYERVLEFFGIIPGPDHVPDNNSYQIKLDLSPNEDDMQAIIESWNNGEDSDDVGFLLTGEQSPIWLSRTYGKYETILNISRNTGDVFNSQNLFNSLLEERPLVLNHI